MPKPEPDPIVVPAIDAALAAGHVFSRETRLDLDKDDRTALERVRKLFSPEEWDLGRGLRRTVPSKWGGKLSLSEEKARVLVSALIRARRDRGGHAARLAMVKETVAAAQTAHAALAKLVGFFNDDREAFDRVQKHLASVIDDSSDLRRQLPRQADAMTARAAAAYIAVNVRVLTRRAHNDLVLDLIDAALGKRISERALKRALAGVKNKVGPQT